jgi:hypothetical protein
MGLVEKFRRHGVLGSIQKGADVLQCRTGLTKFRYRNAPVYANPTDAELSQVERGIVSLGIAVEDFTPSKDDLEAFKSARWFPDNYHGGRSSGVWDEKHLEHWIAYRLLGLGDYGGEDIYIDVAACGSPWAKTLRERNGIAAYANDLVIDPQFRGLDFYKKEDATKTSFGDSSVRGMSLQCAFEMFTGDADTNLINEAARILKPGGKMIILPLYMHTHYCAYSTPDFFGRGRSDKDAVEYIRFDTSNIPSSRKYDAQHLVTRVLKPIVERGMKFRLMVLRNKHEIATGIYCHFILEVTRGRRR